MSENAELVLEVIDAVERRDAEALFERFHDHVEFHDAPSLPYGGTIEGKDAFVRRFEEDPESTWLGTWGPLQPTAAERAMEPRVVAESGDEVVVLYRQRGLAPDGGDFDLPCLALYEVRDGKLIRAQMFHFDTAAIAAFLRQPGSVADAA